MPRSSLAFLSRANSGFTRTGRLFALLMESVVSLGPYAAPLFVGLFISGHLPRLFREIFFAGLCVYGSFLIFFKLTGTKFSHFHFIYLSSVIAVEYLLFVFLRRSKLWLIPVFFPLVVLALGRFSNFFLLSDFSVWLGSWAPPLIAQSGIRSDHLIAGFSYTMARLSLLCIEDRYQKFESLSPFRYLAFCFFPPLLLVGPITGYKGFHQWFEGQVFVDRIALKNSILRITTGAVKYFVLSSLFYQFTFTRLFAESTALSLEQITLAALIYPVYLYLNFSGLVDMVVGLSGLLGFEVAENFDRPLRARNIQDFWNRWHMSLTKFLQQLVFNPLMVNGIRLGIPKELALTVATLIVFTLVGVWHGFTFNYFLFGLLQALALLIFHFLVKGRIRLPLAVAWSLNYVFLCTSLLVFENSWSRCLKIWGFVFG